MAWYVETSAFVKLLVVEDHSTAMRAWKRAHPSCWSSVLLRTEALRTAARLGVDADLVNQALGLLALTLPTTATYHLAATLAPPGMGTLDALHLAAALELGTDLEGLVSYDEQLLAGALAASIPTVSP